MPTNREIEMILTLRDQLTARWNTIKSSLGSSVKSLAVTFQAQWAVITAGWLAVAHSIHALWDWAQEWLKTEQAAGTFRAMVTQMGADAEEQFGKIKEASAGMIEDRVIYQASIFAMSLGIQVKDLSKLMEMARAKARELGTTTADAFQRLTEATGKEAQKKLKGFGVIVDTANAEKQYATELGKTVDQLTAFEKKQAFVNAVLEAGTGALSRQNLEMSTLSEKIQKIQTTIAESKEWIGGVAVRAGMLLYGIVQGLIVGVAEFVRVLLAPFVILEQLGNRIGTAVGHPIEEAQKAVGEFVSKSERSMLDAFSAVTASGEELAGATKDAMGPFNPDDPEGAVRGAESLKEKLGFSVMKARELAYISEEQSKRYREQFELQQRISDFMKQDASVRRALLDEENMAFVKRAMSEVESVDQAEIQGVTDEMTRINDGWNVIFVGMNAGVKSIADSITEGLGKAWDNTFGEATSMLQKFIRAVTMAMAEMLAQAAAKKLITSVLSKIPVIGPVFDALGLSSSAGGGSAPISDMSQASFVGGGGIYLTGRVDISNGKIFLRREMPEYERFAGKKVVD